MMWKESYRLGVDRIDEQHIELFRMTEELIRAIESRASTEAYQKALGFLKDYVVYHFADEEQYQASIGYSGLAEHQKEHREFTNTVLDYEKKLEANGYDLATLKDLAGMLTAWLIYHVADTDQKIVAKEKETYGAKHFGHCVELFSESAAEVMETMAGFDRSNIRLRTVYDHRMQGDVFVEIELTGELSGKAVFGFSKELALYLVNTMTMMELTEIDELVQSALCELTNISCGNAASELAQRRISCDIRPPVTCDGASCGLGVNGVCIDTAAGGLEVVVLVDHEPSL